MKYIQTDKESNWRIGDEEYICIFRFASQYVRVIMCHVQRKKFLGLIPYKSYGKYFKYYETLVDRDKIESLPKLDCALLHVDYAYKLAVRCLREHEQEIKALNEQQNIFTKHDIVNK